MKSLAGPEESSNIKEMMSNEYKQMVKAYLAFVGGFSVFMYGMVLASIITSASPQKYRTLFSGEAGIWGGVIFVLVVAAVLGIPFYLWSAIRFSILKDRFPLQFYYRVAFVAGLITPIILLTLIMLALAVEITLTMFVIIPVIMAELAIKVNNRDFRENNLEGA